MGVMAATTGPSHPLGAVGRVLDEPQLHQLLSAIAAFKVADKEKGQNKKRYVSCLMGPTKGLLMASDLFVFLCVGCLSYSAPMFEPILAFFLSEGVNSPEAVAAALDAGHGIWSKEDFAVLRTMEKFFRRYSMPSCLSFQQAVQLVYKLVTCT